MRQPLAVVTAQDMPIAGPGTGPSPRDALRSPQFIVLAATFFACCATHSGPIFHTVSYAITCGLPPLAAVTIYSVEGLAGLGGRLLFGLLGDRFGAKPALVGGLLVGRSRRAPICSPAISPTSMRWRSCSAWPMAA